ncbi:MAG: flagellar basal body P-ring protein FlgI [Planctomycetes bacterium]|nr:flagellar basal body P-ring protein FlgI [Planctomycetota bacterium]
MLNLLLLASLALAPQGAQDPAAAGPAEAPAAQGNTVLPAWPSIEAPAQPSGRSSSSWSRTRRFAPAPATTNQTATRTPVSSLVGVRGMEENHVMGIGLVTGLAGTGDSASAAKQLLQNLLLTRTINVDLQALSSKNIAVVLVEADLPSGTKEGRTIDVRVSTIGDAASLQGGTLVMTELTDMMGRDVYVTAAGPITVGGFSAGGESATATKNHVTVGTLPDGGKVQREVPTSIVSEHGFIYLDIKAAHNTFGNVVNIAEAVNALYPGLAEATGDGKSIRVRVPEDLPSWAHAEFAATILRQEVLSENMARVIINERSGVIVMGGDVRLQPGVIAYGNLTVTIAETPEASQPGPLSGGTTQNMDRTNLAVEEENSALVLAPGAVTLQEVVDVLNVLGTTPRDMITVLQAMSQAGTLLAEIKRM